MKKDEANPLAPSGLAQAGPAPDTPWLTERLTEAEIEALRQDQREAIAYVQKTYYPNLRISRVKDDLPEGPAGDS